MVEYVKVNSYMEVTDEDIEGEFGEIFTPEQKDYLKANKEDLTSQVEQEIMYNHWQRIARKEAIWMLIEAGLADGGLL